jgi:predicted ribosomally synthesized peptide with nif11-like leader
MLSKQAVQTIAVSLERKELKMAHERVVAFWQRVQNDKGLQDSIQGLTKTPKEQRLAEMVRLGEQKGYSFTAAELLEFDAVMAFWQKVHGDTKLQEKLQPIQQLGAEAAASEVIRIAGESGFPFSKEALEAATKAQVQAGSLGNAELAKVAGGLTKLDTSWVRSR